MQRKWDDALLQLAFKPWHRNEVEMHGGEAEHDGAHLRGAVPTGLVFATHHLKPSTSSPINALGVPE